MGFQSVLSETHATPTSNLVFTPAFVRCGKTISRPLTQTSYTHAHTRAGACALKHFHLFPSFSSLLPPKIERPKQGQPLKYVPAYVNSAPSRTGLKTISLRFAEVIDALLGAPNLPQARHS